MTLEAASNRANNSFGLLRLLAALAVVVSHTYYLTDGRSAAEPLYSATGFTLGQHAVHAFFVMSGFMVAASLDRSRDFKRYAAARALRIIPGLVVCVFASGLVIGPLLTQLPLSAYFGDRQTVEYLVKTLALATGSAALPGVFGDNPVAAAINIPLWTLKYEIACYAILVPAAVIGLAGRRRSTAMLSTLLFASCIAVIVWHRAGDAEPSYALLARFLLAFWLGVTAHSCRHSIVVHSLWPAAALFAYALAFDSALHDVATVAFTAVLTLWAGSLRWRWPQRLTTAHDLSYGIYIYGWPVSQSLIALDISTTPLSLAFSSLALLLPLAFASWHIVEKPALRALPARPDGNASAGADAPQSAVPAGRMHAVLQPQPRLRLVKS